eukprot:NODE_1543_length_1131_cov_74.870610_g1255_i0.p1 GENE.NODE_1543_length_1131_cov_74.870610_g1255_i0~~NODE_1543_length_1131_cov_74.870610_g1255_i0.p1  ORF type:complete len:230 (-),score=72.83 NODE_1543_length_1131_cov_74.870610_g1255_i0:176-865(-)
MPCTSNGKLLVTGLHDGSCSVWDVKRGTLATSFEGHQGLVVMVKCSPSSGNVVSCSADHSLIMWEAQNGRRRQDFVGHEHVVMACGWAADNTRIVSNDANTVRIWNSRNGTQTHCLGTEAIGTVCGTHDQKFIVCAFCPSGYIVMSTNNKSVLLLDPSPMAVVASMQSRESVYSISAVTKSVLAFGDGNGNVYVVNFRLESDKTELPVSALLCLQQMDMTLEEFMNEAV